MPLMANLDITRQNCVHNRLKLFVVKWLGLSAAVNVRVCAREREWTSLCFWWPYEVINTFVLLS